MPERFLVPQFLRAVKTGVFCSWMLALCHSLANGEVRFITSEVSLSQSDESFADTSKTGPAGILRGVVTDVETGERLAGANIKVLPKGSTAPPSGTASGAQGEFELRDLTPGTYTIIVSYLGYDSKVLAEVTIAAGQAKTLEVSLFHHGIQLNPVTINSSRPQEISASRRPQKIFEAPAAITLVDASDIHARSILTPVEHLKGLPAVDFVGFGINQSSVVVRGFNSVFSGALLSLSDNRITGVPSLRYNAYNLIPTTNEDIDRIEVVSGPAAALYGPNSANGLMQIITKSPFGSEGTSMTIGRGERVGVVASFRHAGSFNKRVGYRISSQYYQGTDWRYDDPVEPDSFGVGSNKVPSPGRDFNVEKLGAEARIDFRLADDFTSMVSAGLNRMSDIELTGIGAAQAKDWTYSYVQGRLLYKNLFAQAFLNRSDAGQSYILRTGVPVVDKSSLFVAQVQHDFTLANRQRFTYGLDILRTRPDTEETINGRNEDRDNINETGAFLQSETALGSKADFIAAFRIDDHNHIKEPVFSPRAALVYKPSQNHRWRVTYNRAFSTPSTNNLFLDILSASVPSPLPSPFPRTLIAVRAVGVPSETGFTFRRDGDGRPMMRSQLAPGAGYVPSTVNAVWPTLRQILIAGSPRSLQALLNATLPMQLGAPVLGDLRKLNTTTGGFDLVNNVNDVAPMKPTITNTLEAGYKGLIGNKLLFAADVYHTRVDDFIGPLIVETPNVFANPQQLAAALQPTGVAITNALITQGMPPAQAQAQAASIVSGLVSSAAKLPLGVISPNEIANDTDVILTYRNFGSISLTGADLSFTYYAGRYWRFSGSYSYVSRNFFEKHKTQPHDISLNAPKHKFGVGIHYNNFAKGWDTQFRLRYVDGFPVNSGVFIGDVRAYTVLDLDSGYDLGWQIKVSLTVQNLLDRRYQEFVGAPKIGRLLITRLTKSF
jgi:iron complex outermembrane receptor protein